MFWIPRESKMRLYAIAMLGLISLVSAKPALLSSVPLTYATPLTSGTQVGISREQTLDRPKVSAAHLDERRTNSANEAGKSVGPRERESFQFVNDSAPLGVDGRVVDTPEVAAAKAAHVAAHVNEKINLANEAARSSGVLDSSRTSDEVILTETVIGPDGRVPNTPKVAAIRGAHVNRKSNPEAGDALARLVEGSLVPLVLGNGVVAALVPVGLDGRPLNVPETPAAPDERPHPANDVRSVDALAVAGPALAYGRLIY
ncbi:hypothetical protein RF55_6656 [Lasius niger]|uniref:Uncharacterized protein n=1 Tax=Lasius niger TaxID=67767 RepID=A0A0J7KSG1_LASNI|nr:hypothetical protein RF55_6656 [Lasius niger]